MRGVEAVPSEDGSTLFTVRYGAEGEGDLELRLHLAGEPATLRLGDRPERWTRAPRNWGMR